MPCHLPLPPLLHVHAQLWIPDLALVVRYGLLHACHAIGSMLGDLPRCLLLAVMYAVPFMSLLALQGDKGTYFLIIFLNVWVWTGELPVG